MFEAILLALTLGVIDQDNGPERIAAMQDAPVDSTRCVNHHNNDNWFVCQDSNVTTLVHRAPLWDRIEYDVVLAAEDGKIFWMDLSKCWRYNENPELWRRGLSWSDADDAFDDGIEIRFREGKTIDVYAW